MNLLQHPLVRVIATIPTGRFNFVPASYTNLGERRSGHARFDVQLIVVANAAGLTTFPDYSKWDALHDIIHDLGIQSDKQPWNLQLRRPTPRATPATLHLGPEFLAAAPEQTRTTMSYVAPQHVIAPAALRQLKWAPTAIAYTDGSAKNGIAGAGAAWSGTTPLRTARIYVGPGSSLKAELCAITHVVHYSDAAEDLHVATDCLTAMSAIQNGLLNSLSMHGHAEEASLRDAVSELHRRTRRTTFLKVKAHVGITLNEVADKEANAARKLPAPTAPAGGAVPGGKPAHGVVMANGDKASKKLIAEAYAVVRADIIRDAESARVERAAAAEAAADGAGPSVPRRVLGSPSRPSGRISWNATTACRRLSMALASAR